MLPLALEDYLDDFATKESKQGFRELLSKSNRPVLLREKLIRDERRDPEDKVEPRRDAYLAAGHYVVDHIDLLIAVWVGGPFLIAFS